MSPVLTGYGPSIANLIFNGDETLYEMWELKFLSYMRLKNLHEVFTAKVPDPEKNAQAFAELTLYLDSRSLSLIMRDARDDGKAALSILRNHYLSSSKPRVINLYNELTSLLKRSDESITDYVLCAETSAVMLKAANEIISDSLLVAMVLKGLPNQ